MSPSSAPLIRGLVSYSSGASDSDLVECFESLWHYDCVISPQSAHKPFSSPAQSPVALSHYSPFGSAPSNLSAEEQSSLLRESFPLSLSMHRLQPLFQMLDENSDGKVSVDEMMCLLHKLGTDLSQSCLLSLMEPLDGNADMALDFAEFTALYHAICGGESARNTQEEGAQQADAELDFEEFRDTFNVYDRNRDGYISASELAEVLRELGFPEGMDLEKCQTLIDRVDTDGNGLVDLREFKEMLQIGCGISETPAALSCASEAKAKTSEPGQLSAAYCVAAT